MSGWPVPARRRMLQLGVGAGLAACLPASSGGAAVPTAGRIGGADVPSRLISLADCGGKPGAQPARLVAAFGRAFALLAAGGGGTLLVPPGLYDFGRIGDTDAVILCRGARDIVISAYGAHFRATTSVGRMPNLFYFFNFHNVTVAGARFSDGGFTPWRDWQGMYCVGIQADTPSNGFRMIDCHAERVLGLLASHNGAAMRQYLSGVSVHGGIRNAYYGVGANNIRGGVALRLACHNVRRALIAYALRDADILVRVGCDRTWPGSNGLVALVCAGASMGNVENVRVRVDVDGHAIHRSYVHFYHQGPEHEGRMCDIDATVNLLNVRDARQLFVFDHESDGVCVRTNRVWDRIALHGTVIGAYEAQAIANPSVSGAPGTVRVDPGLAGLVRAGSLAATFRTLSPQ